MTKKLKRKMLKKPAKNLELESLIQKTAADLSLLFTRQDDRGIGPWHFHIDAIAGDWIADLIGRYDLTRGDVDYRQLALADKQAMELERWNNDKERVLEEQDSERQTSVEALYKLRVGEGPGYHDPHCGRPGEVGGSEPRGECAPGGDVEAGSERIVHRDPESKQLRLSFGDEATRLEFWGEMNSMQRKVEAAADKDIKLDVVINRYIYDSMIKGKITSPDGRNSFEIDDELLQHIDLENMTPSQESVIRGMWIAGNILDLEMGHAGIRTSELHEKEIIALDQLREIRDLYDPKPLMQKEMATWDDEIQEVANDYMATGADDFERWQIFNAIKGHHLGRPIVTQHYAQEFMEVGEWTDEVGGPGVRPEFLAVTMHDAQREGNLSEEVALQMVDTYTERANKYGTLENTYALYHNRRGGIKSYIFTHIDNMLPGQWIPPDEREEIRNTADLLNEGWSISTQDLGGVALSEAVADVYGGEAIPRENNRVYNGEQNLSAEIGQYMNFGSPDYQSYSPSDLAQEFLDNDELETESREWVKTMYERTQEYFKYYGLNSGDTVRLYRGMNTLASPAWNPNGDEGPAVVEMWSASSWTTDIETARRFANGTGSGDDMTAVDGAIVVSDIPIERILSTPQTGFGCKHETEFIVLGQDGIEATVYNETARSDDDIELMLDFWSTKTITRGGPGSGHFGHAGRPGQVGGSAPSQVNFGWKNFRGANSWGTRRNRALDSDEVDPTGDGLRSLGFYVNFGYIQLNDWLRKGKKDYRDLALEDNKNAMASLDQLLSHYPLEENVVIYRGVSEDFFKRLKPDKVFRDKGYVSTTLVEKRLSPGFHKGEIGFHATLEIHVPKGVHGYYVGGGFGPTNEYEFLLERGLRFQVEEIREVGSRAVLRVVPNE